MEKGVDRYIREGGNRGIDRLFFFSYGLRVVRENDKLVNLVFVVFLRFRSLEFLFDYLIDFVLFRLYGYG